METIYSSMFRCLCLDLGYEPIGEVPVEELGSLKNALLELTELAEGWTVKCEEHAAFCQRFQRWFRSPCGELDRLMEPAVFKDVYQILSFLLKKPAVLTETHINEYIAKFKATEQETRQWRVDPKGETTRVARNIVRYITACGPSFTSEEVISWGRHGPGAVLGGEKGSDKNYFSSLPKTARKMLDCLTLYANDNMASLEADGTDVYVKSRLTLVPKTYKGPRGVFVSPKEAVFCQLALDGLLKNSVRSCKRFRGCWDPTSQIPSQELALSGSYSGWFATLDLSDASDRIPLSLVNYLFRRPDYLALARCRPSHVILPDGMEHRLAMFAPMGDGKTFSVLSIVCLALSVATIYVEQGGLAARFDVKEASRVARSVRVFGDDIIVPAEHAAAVMSTLELHNLKVNRSKSFVRGRFREACGCDAYKGVVVTPLRVTNRLFDLSDETLTNWVSFANRIAVFYPRFERLRSLVYSYISKRYDIGRTTRPDRNPDCLYDDHGYLVSREVLVQSHITCQSDQSSSVKYVYKVPYTKGLRMRYNPDLQRFEQRCIVRRGEVEYPRARDPRWDLSYWLLPKKSSELECPLSFISDHILVRGSYAEYRALIRLQRQLPFAKRWLLFPERRLRYAWVPLE